MKKILNWIIIIMLLVTYRVNAAEYKLMELIPINTGGNITITTDHFKYIDIKYKDNIISFGSIRNISDAKRPVTLTIGLFDKEKKNIGTINYCSSADDTSTLKDIELDTDQGVTYQLQVNKTYLASNKSFKDIKYFSILSDNINCNTGNALEYVGEKVDKIGQVKNNTLNSSEKLLIYILLFIGGVGLFVFLNNFAFSTKYENIDGDDVRNGYKKYNKKLARQREYEAIINPPKPKPVKKEKSDKVIMEEESEKAKENTDSSDLHNFYK